MSETREPRPKDVHGNEIVMGAWYWSRNRKRQVIGTGKFACAIGGGDVTWFINGIGYSPEGFEFVPVDSPSFDLINVPEPAESVVSYSDTWPGMATEIAALRTLATAAERRMESLEERLAAIERAATCGTGPNEPGDNSPAQAAVGEAAAVSEWPRYYRHKQDRGGYVRYESANEPGRIVRFDGGPAAPWTWTYQQAIEFCLDGTWHEVPAAEAEARIASARGEKQNCDLPSIQDLDATTTEPCKEWRDDTSFAAPDAPPFRVGKLLVDIDDMLAANEQDKPGDFKRGFRDALQWVKAHIESQETTHIALPPTAERESEPTPGMVFMADESRGISTIRAIVECVMMNLHQNNHDFRLRDKLIVAAAPYLEKHEKETAALRAECERLTKELSAPEYQYAGDRIRREAIECRNNEISDLRQQLATARKKLEQEEQAHLATIDERDRAVDAADRLAAIAGDESVIGEHSNTNDPWKNAAEILATAREAAEASRVVEPLSEKEQQAILQVRQDHEAMEWLTQNDCSLHVVYSPVSSGFQKVWRVETFPGRFPTPTAAILAARDAATTNTGEK